MEFMATNGAGSWKLILAVGFNLLLVTVMPESASRKSDKKEESALTMEERECFEASKRHNDDVLRELARELANL